MNAVPPTTGTTTTTAGSRRKGTMRMLHSQGRNLGFGIWDSGFGIRIRGFGSRDSLLGFGLGIGSRHSHRDAVAESGLGIRIGIVICEPRQEPTFASQ